MEKTKVTPKTKVLSTEDQLKKLQAKVRKLETENKSLKKDNVQAQKDALRAKDSKFVLFESTTDQENNDISKEFKYFIYTVNSDRSITQHHFDLNDPQTSKKGNVYYKGYRIHVPKTTEESFSAGVKEEKDTSLPS